MKKHNPSAMSNKTKCMIDSFFFFTYETKSNDAIGPGTAKGISNVTK